MAQPVNPRSICSAMTTSSTNSSSGYLQSRCEPPRSFPGAPGRVGLRQSPSIPESPSAALPVQSSSFWGWCGRTHAGTRFMSGLSRQGKKKASPCTRVTVDLEDRRTGETIATQTLSASTFEDAAEVVAGYVAWSIFKDDPTTPSWCYGAVDGEDIAALLLTREQRVDLSSGGKLESVRREQIRTLEKCRLESGVSRYELAQLFDLEGDHVKALWLHAKNREQYPRFFRGRYRLAMSLEMVADRNFSDCGFLELRSHPVETRSL